MKRLFTILFAALGPVAITVGQEDSTKARVRASPSGKVTAPLIDSAFSTHPMPNAYRGDNCVAMPNAYRSDNAVAMPNLYDVVPLIKRHTADSTKQPFDKDKRKTEKKARAQQPTPR
ncbi:hypothetical protein [Parapedobacter koreensis]|uniref:Uncharacterized protein n=1 Tax=Parapedobacter koreensis TaxID=332977 RepID=A0A1H7Q6Y9_9SPHI|nr:hypothetical protein [Parapedobacter koreensis]SEL43921.1 hypothetical protein SAMN05421740_105220 [Parapedobacter koreensis]